MLGGHISPKMSDVKIKQIKSKPMPKLLINNNKIADICLKVATDSVKNVQSKREIDEHKVQSKRLLTS